MKSDSKLTKLGYTTRRASDDAFEFFEFVPKIVFVLLLFCTIRNKMQYDNKTYREILRMCTIFPVIIDIISRCCDDALT